jgi:hypothetical protein
MTIPRLQPKSRLRVPTIEQSIRDRGIFGATLGDLGSWATWIAVL